jgi:alkylation response protein AidB-like acyl-CoA dehydrogenase
LEDALPGLDQRLAAVPLSTWERAGGEGLAAFRASGGPGLLIPRQHGGTGADLATAVRVQRAIAARSPSLALATTLHHVAVASLVETGARTGGREWMLLAAIARNRLLVGPGCADAPTHPGPPTTGVLRGGSVVLNGSQRPCGPARSMDLLTVTVALRGEDGGIRPAVAVVPARAAGVSVRRLRRSSGYAGMGGDEVVLTDVEVSEDLLMPDPLPTKGFQWLDLLGMASCLGAVATLAQRLGAVGDRKGSANRTGARVASAVTRATVLLDATAAGARATHPTHPIHPADLAALAACHWAVRHAVDTITHELESAAPPVPAEIVHLAEACRTARHRGHTLRFATW